VKLPAYPRTKPSGVEWLGDVPEHWGVNRVKWSTLGCVNGVWGEEPNGVDDIVCVRVADFDRDNFLVADEPPTLRAIEPSQLKTRQLRKGDLLIEKSGGGEKQLVGCVVSFNHDFRAVCSNFVARMPIVPELPPRFWCYVHAALYAGKLNYPAIKQTTGIQNLDSSAYLDTPAPFPGISEQQSIAAFLDREMGRLDQLMAKKRQLIERLKEKRTALIARTVTRGLPPVAARAAGLPEKPPLKSSGLDWLGDIPAHWGVMALKWRSRCHSGDSIATEDAAPEPTPERNVPVIGGNGVMGYCDSSNCEHPVLVIGRVGALCGNVHLIAPPAWITDNALVMPTDAATFSWKYLAAVLRTRNLNELADKTAQPLITGTRVRNERIPVPPLPEQTAIAAYLDQEAAKLDALVGKVEAAEERLQEYRTALIIAAVTGKIDVRKAAA
jgi:type I restriction enzyme S subunit